MRKDTGRVARPRPVPDGLRLAVGLVFHGAALYMCLSSPSTAAEALRDVPVVIVLDWALGVALAFGADVPYLRLGLLAARLGLLELVFYPTAGMGTVKLALLCAFASDAAFALESPVDLGAFAAGFLVLAASQSRRKVWDAVVPAAGPDELLALAVFPLAVFSMARRLRTASGRLAASRRELMRIQEGTQRIIDANVRFQDFVQETEQSSIEKERARITREIHDIVGYALTNQNMALEASLVLLGQPDKAGRLRELLSTARDQAKEGLAEVRAALHQLRRASSGADVLTRIVRMCRSFQEATGTEVGWHSLVRLDGLAPDLELAVYRFIQEGLTNSFLHGKAVKVDVAIKLADGLLGISVSDDGRGADDISEGIGLSGMRERLVPWNGTIRYSKLDPGFRIEALIPLDSDWNRPDGGEPGGTPAEGRA